MIGQERLPRRVEVLAGLSVAIDLGLGQPAEHMLRSAVIACRLSGRLGLDDAQRTTVFYSTLLMWIGCHADSQEYARWFGDDIAVRRDAYYVDWSVLPYMRFLMSHVAQGEPRARRIATMVALMRNARGQLGAMVHSHCMSAAALAVHLGLGDDVARVIGYSFERFDGNGLPRGVAGVEIPIEMRVAQLADTVEVHHRAYGIDAAVAMARERRGGHFDPAVVDAFVSRPRDLFGSGEDAYATAIDLAPVDDVPLDDAGLDPLLRAIGDFTDLKCPFTLGHSRAVAGLAEAAGRRLGLPGDEVELVRRAGYVHDVGRLGISNLIWSKPGRLTSAEWERVRMHPYLTDRVLRSVPGLAGAAAIARAHHENLDGSGYPLGIGASGLGRSERLLAATVAYRSALEPRPYRDPLTTEDAAARVRRRAAHGELDGAAVEAVLGAAGHRASRIRRADTLTPREAEVLGLVARGLSNREIAARLVLSEKTVRNHVERSYVKIGATNRVGASLYALQSGLAGTFD